MLFECKKCFVKQVGALHLVGLLNFWSIPCVECGYFKQPACPSLKLSPSSSYLQRDLQACVFSQVSQAYKQCPFVVCTIRVHTWALLCDVRASYGNEKWVDMKNAVVSYYTFYPNGHRHRHTTSQTQTHTDAYTHWHTHTHTHKQTYRHRATHTYMRRRIRSRILSSTNGLEPAVVKHHS